MTHTSPQSLSSYKLFVGLMLGSLAALLWFAPGQWLALAVQSLTHEQLQLRQVRGTVWDGSAQWVLAAGSGGREALALPQRMHWRIRPDWDASLNMELHIDCCSSQALEISIKPNMNGLHLSLNNIHSVWPAQWLSGLGAPWNSMNLQGHLALNSQQLQWHLQRGEWHMSGTATLEMRQLSSSLSTLKPLGTYVVQLQGGPTPTLQLHTSDGKLQLQGSGSWQAGHFSFQGEAWAMLGYENALNNLLGVLGQRAGDKTILRLG